MSKIRSSTKQGIPATLFLVLLAALYSSPAVADLAKLVAEAVLVETNPEPTPQGEEVEGPVPPAVIGVAKNASYVSSGGWAVTSSKYIDKATFVFDFASVKTVSGATLILPIETVFTQNGSAPIKLEFFSDNGKIEFTDYTNGFPAAIGQTDAAGKTEVRFDVTGAVNAALNTGRFIGFRVLSTLAPSAVNVSVPAFTGVKFRTGGRAQLEFVPGAPPVTDPNTGSFDGYTLEVPHIEIPTIGEVYAQFRLIDPNQQIFKLTTATVTGTGTGTPLVSGIQLFDCAAFSPPPGSAIVSTGNSSYSINSGILDIPDTTFKGSQFSVRMEFIEGSDPMLFDLLNFNAISTNTEAIDSDLTGGLVVEPTQDFVPACHGWIIIGDSIRNRLVERNVISGETGKVYPFNTIPDQMTFDEANGIIYFTVHPESARLYKLNLHSGLIQRNFVSQTLNGLTTSHTYTFSLRDLAIGENGNIFALMIDRVLMNPGDSVPYTSTGKWLGLMNTNAGFLTNSLPLEEPIRIEYDPVLDHVFLATQSNLATFNFNPATNAITFVQGTDVEVGSGCTDFSISPDGTRLAYSCPAGNDKLNEEFSIWDMDPTNYFNIDGEWFLESAPISATFNQSGTILIASDNEKLYFFDVWSHLLLEDFKLGLLEGETVKRIRFSKDGAYIIISLNNEAHIPNSKFLYMKTPAITGTPLPP